MENEEIFIKKKRGSLMREEKIIKRNEINRKKYKK